jgi:nucleotide-binding universal stress UspA family protein
MFKTIVWATDGSEAADQALPYAKELATGPGHALLAVHCREIYTGRAGGYPVLADEEELEAKIREQVVQARGEGIDATFTLSTGPASGAVARMIADAAREVDADVIVVGTRGHGALTGLLVGSVTQRVLHVAPCPVLAIPAGKHALEHEPQRETATSAR